MNNTRLIGIGSPFGNDNIGWRAIERLKQHRAIASLPEPVDLFDCDRPGVNLIPLFAGAKCVVLLDAILAPDQHGEVIQVDTEQLMHSHGGISSHNLDAAAAIALAATLHSLPERLSIIGLGVDTAQTLPLGSGHIDKLIDKAISVLNVYFRCRIPA